MILSCCILNRFNVNCLSVFTRNYRQNRARREYNDTPPLFRWCLRCGYMAVWQPESKLQMRLPAHIWSTTFFSDILETENCSSSVDRKVRKSETEIPPQGRIFDLLKLFRYTQHRHNLRFSVIPNGCGESWDVSLRLEWQKLSLWRWAVYKP